MPLPGVVLGLVCWKSGKNLVASVVAHTLFSALPAMTLIHFTIRFGG